MANLLNNASLLLNPAGSTIAYKEDKIYSVIPNNGAGDFTFSGGGGGTRVNQQGYVEQTPANLLSYSENVVTYWTKQLVTVTANTIPGPFGRLATRVVETATTGAHRIYTPNTFTGNKTTFTMYLKAYETNASDHRMWIEIWNGTQGIMNQTKFDLATGVVTQNTGTAFAKYLGDGWWELNCFTTVEVLYTTNYLIFSGNDATRDPAGSTSEGFYFAGAQVTAGHIVRPYQPTTDRLNYPRITYQNGRGALMGELQRTNYVLSSSSCNWGGYQGSTLTLNNAISPDGTQNATLLTVSTTQYSGVYYQVNRGTEVPVVSIFAKAGTLPFIYFVNPAGNALVAWYDLRNGTVSNVTAGYNAYMEPYKDGWYRCVLGCPSQTNNYLQLGVTDTSGAAAASYSGTIYIWGGQNEVGTYNINYATSYIPTTTATVTRPSDIPYVSGVSSLVGQSSGGTLYVSGVPRASEEEFVAITPGGYTTVDGVFLYYTSGNNLRLYVVGGSTVQVGGNSANINVGQYFKAAVRYGNGSTAYYVNGQQIVTTAAALAFTNTLNQIDLRGNTYYYSTPGAQEISTIATYTTALSNAQLQELTTVRSGSGGNISYYGPYTIHTFTGSATFTPSFNGEVEVLVVAGGGSGGVGSNGGGGGGAGGLLYASSYGVAQGTGITVTVGAGGGSRIGRGSGNNGSNSVFGGLTAVGGGGGGGASAGPAFGKDGGSAGGAQYSSAGGNGIPGQGNNGGDGNYYLGGNHDAGGGGGGAGFAGLDATLSNAGNGGDGLLYSISGLSTYYAGGGGGSSNNQSATPPMYPGEGGLGGGGKGGINGTTLLGTDGVDGLGAGGGAGVGASGGNSGAGGDGIVIVRYLT